MENIRSENIQKKFLEIDSFHFTSFLARTFLNFLAYWISDGFGFLGKWAKGQLNKNEGGTLKNRQIWQKKNEENPCSTCLQSILKDFFYIK